jgi:hypothetical protein
VTSFTVATAANYADSERLQGDTASNKDAAPQHNLQFIDYIEYCQSTTRYLSNFMLRHNNTNNKNPMPQSTPARPADSSEKLVKSKAFRLTECVR